MGCNNTKESTQQSGLREEESDKIVQEYDKPVVIIDGKSEKIDNVVVPPRKGDFTITVEKTDASEKIGVHMRLSVPKQTVMSVGEIYEEGALYKYNARASPETRIKIGDYIWDVNGVSGDTDKMLDQLKQATSLTITLQRSDRSTGDVTIADGDRDENNGNAVNSDGANEAEKPATTADGEILQKEAAPEAKVVDDAAETEKKEKAVEEIANDAFKLDNKNPGEPSVDVSQATLEKATPRENTGTQAEVVLHADEVGPPTSKQQSVCCSSASTACS